MKVLPFFLPVISIGYPAGLGLYYFLQGLCRIGTQSYITRKFYGDDEGTTTVIDTSASEKAEPTDMAGKARALLTGVGKAKVVQPGRPTARRRNPTEQPRSPTVRPRNRARALGARPPRRRPRTVASPRGAVGPARPARATADDPAFPDRPLRTQRKQ